MELEIKISKTENRSSTAGFISWERLSELFRRSGELKPDEQIEHLVAGRQGLQYYVEEREDS